MPYSYVQYTGTGTAPLLSVPFPYLRKAHVRLYTGYDLLTDTWTAELTDGVGFTWTSATQVQLSSDLANGVVLTIIRKTPIFIGLVDWNDASNLLTGDLDTADRQTLYAVQEQRDRVVLAATVADAASDAVSGVVLYSPVLNVAAIPATPTSGSRIELIDSTGIEGFSPLSGRPTGFVGSDQLRVRMSWDGASGTWVWGSYFTTDPDGRYVRQSSISNSTSSTSQTTVASSLAVKTAKDSADTAKATADTAKATADTAKATADTAKATADTAKATADTALATANGAWQPVDATATTKGLVQLADAAALAARTAGRVVDAAQLNAAGRVLKVGHFTDAGRTTASTTLASANTADFSYTPVSTNSTLLLLASFQLTTSFSPTNLISSVAIGDNGTSTGAQAFAANTGGGSAGHVAPVTLQATVSNTSTSARLFQMLHAVDNASYFTKTEYIRFTVIEVANS